MSISASLRRTCLLVVLLLFLGLIPASALAAPGPAAWSLTDRSGRAWNLRLIEQADPSYPAGWRLRLNARAPGIEPDHESPLAIEDGMGGTWKLGNRSGELVPAGEATLPAGSAQFHAGDLLPRPGGERPLRMRVTLLRAPAAEFILGPDVVEALHDLPDFPGPPDLESIDGQG